VDEAARAKFDWTIAAPPAELAAELMAAFGPDKYETGVIEGSLRRGDAGSRYWCPTRFGLATFAQGKDAVRQRIKDRTGL